MNTTKYNFDIKCFFNLFICHFAH